MTVQFLSFEEVQMAMISSMITTSGQLRSVRQVYQSQLTLQLPRLCILSGQQHYCLLSSSLIYRFIRKIFTDVPYNSLHSFRSIYTALIKTFSVSRTFMTSYAVQIKGGSRSPVNSFRTTIQRATPAIHLNYFIAKDISARSYFAPFDKKLI